VALISLVLILAAGDELEDIEDAGVVVAILLIVVAVTILAGLLQVMGGVRTLAMKIRGWALGMAGSIIGLVLGILSFAGSSQAGTTGANLLLVALLFIGDIVILAYLGQARKTMTA
jgi:hypothetical protein